MKRRRNDGLVVLRPLKNSLGDHSMRNKRRHVQATFMSAHGEALFSGELPREVHPLRPKPVVNPDDLEARWLIFLSNTNGKRPRLRDELNRISQLRGNEICDSTVHSLFANTEVSFRRCAPIPKRAGLKVVLLSRCRRDLTVWRTEVPSPDGARLAPVIPIQSANGLSAPTRHSTGLF